jgi:carboxyl-terminal processing protease
VSKRARFAASLLLAAASSAAAQSADSAKTVLRKRTVYEDLQMFSQVLNQIRVNHVDSIDTHELFLAAVSGMVRAADPHSYVIPAVRLDTAKERELTAGRLVPVPIDFRYVGGTPVVSSVAPSSETARQDILPGDALVAVDGRHVLAESPMELEVLLAGPRNSRVNLTVERRRIDGSLVRLDRAVRRERVDEATAVPVAFMLDSSTGYARITSFEQERVAEDLHDAVGRLESQGMKRLVLDLRGNGGGRIDQAAKVAGEFLPKGAVVYTIEGRKEDVIDTARVSRSFWKHERSYPLALLVDDGTASASELLAGALQDHDRAIIVGRPTFGKALVMRGFPMTDGSVIVLVMGRLRTPCGRLVQREYRGITTADYYRMAAADRDTAGRPTCKTDSGRIAYGGGGIYPDVRLTDPADEPLWLARVRELNLPEVWAGSWVTANAGRLTTIEALVTSPLLGADALADFRSLAASKGIQVPPESDSRLQRALVGSIAFARFGEAGLLRYIAATDPQIAQAAKAFDRPATGR